jgi:hypothetical protein
MASLDGRLSGDHPGRAFPRYPRNEDVSPAAIGVGKDQAPFAFADRLLGEGQRRLYNRHFEEVTAFVNSHPSA